MAGGVAPQGSTAQTDAGACFLIEIFAFTVLVLMLLDDAVAAAPAPACRKIERAIGACNSDHVLVVISQSSQS
jgi:hypothetical protein